jgi:D-proline reductase (dithiol) PrdB
LKPSLCQINIARPVQVTGDDMVELVDIPEPERSVIAELDCPAYEDTALIPAVSAGERHVAIVSSAGFILRGERPMLSNETGYRAIAASVADTDILCSHVSTNFDRSGFQQDINVMLPRDRLLELEQEGYIGKAAETHYAFMGATSPLKLENKARELGRRMLALGVNTVVLAPV